MPPDPGPHRGLRPLSRRPAADPGPPATLVLLRHGSTDDTAQHRVRGGDGDGPELNQAGREQARRAAELLTAWPGFAASPAMSVPSSPAALAVSAVVLVASPALRARQTADVLAEMLGRPAELDADWSEVALGDWDGLNYAEIAARWPAQYRAWLGSSSIAPPNGESMDDVGKRVAAARDGLVRGHPGRTAIVVTHTAPIRTVISRALDAGSAALWRLRIDPASITVVHYWADGGCEVAAVNTTTALPMAAAGASQEPDQAGTTCRPQMR